MTDNAALNPVIFDADPVSKLKRVAARIGRALCRAMAVHGTRRALNGLPDYLLTDLGIARGDIAFVAASLFDAGGDPTRDRRHRVNRSVTHQCADVGKAKRARHQRRTLRWWARRYAPLRILRSRNSEDRAAAV